MPVTPSAALPGPPAGLTGIRASSAAAWAGPLLIFLVFSLLVSVVRSDTVGAPWYLAHPEQWLYPLQTLGTLAAVAFWWPHYRFRPLGRSVIAWGTAAGIIGIVLWILPSWLFDRGLVPQNDWLGFTSRAGDRTSFNPEIWASSPGIFWSAVLLRFMRMTLAVAFAEELFWRGFLWRTVSNPYQEFDRTPFGQASAKALGATVLFFMLAHSQPDRLAAIVWCLIVSLLYVRTKSVGACVVAHAVSNLTLGFYIMFSRQWGFW